MTESPPPSVDPSAVAARAVRGVAWTGGGQVVLQAIQIATSIALARLLAPEHFGLIGMAMVFIGVAQLLADFGLGTAIVQARDPDALTLSSAFWANAAVGATLCLATVALSPVFAALYEHPDVQPVIAVLSVSLFAAALTAVPNAILYKAMDFPALAKIRIAASAFAAAVAIGMAVAGFGVWSLVAQPIAGAVVNLALTWRFARWLPRPRFSWSSLDGLIGFSAAMLGGSMFHYVGRNADGFLIGKYLGSEPLGYYAMATQLMLYPVNQVSAVIIRVLFPTLTQLRDSPDYFRRAYLKSASAIAVVTFPIMLGLIAVSHDFIVVVFGEKWLPMETLVRILALVGMGQSVTTGVSSVLTSIGRAKTTLVLSGIGFVLSIAAYIVGLRWGVEGVAAAYAVVYFLYVEAYSVYVFQLVGLRSRDFHAALLRPTLAAGAMAAIVAALSIWLADQSPAPVRLAVCVATGVASYGVLSWWISREEILSILGMLKSLKPRRA